MNYAQHRAAIESIYEDRATISRLVETKTASKETKLSPGPVPVYSDQPCRISQKSLGHNDQTEAQNDIRYETKLFIAPELEIMQGDVIEVTRGTVTRAYIAGEPFLYTSHQEVSLQRRGYA
jgi:hypothetical protein